MKSNKSSAVEGFKLIFRSLQYRNYRLFFGGQGISLIGTWMQKLALSWLIYRLTNSAFLLGFVGFTSQIPTFFLGPFSGVVADRLNRLRIIITTQTLYTIQAFVLAFLVLYGHIQVWQIILLSIFSGLVDAFDIPTRQAFVIEMVEKKEDLGNAIALNSMMFNGARLIGPSIAGILIAAFGEGICFLLNGISYIAVIIALFAMKISPRKPRSQNTHIFEELKEGFNYAFNFIPIRMILLLLNLLSLMGLPYVILMPVFARDILKGGPHTLGFLMGATGIGALMGALFLASRKKVLGLEKIIPVAGSIFCIGIIAFSFSRILLVSLILMVTVGFGMMAQLASMNTVIQTIVDDDKRGRVMSIYAMAFMGTTPFGSLISGYLASKIGAGNTLMIGGICCLVGVIIFYNNLPALRKTIHPIYVKIGIIPEVAKGLRIATELSSPPEN